jgi:hypothetical protein
MKKSLYFSRAQLRALREQFGSVEKVNPDGAQFNAFRRYVNGLPKSMREQLAANNIRWLSYLSRGSLV